MAVIRRVECRVEAMQLPLRQRGFAQPEDTHRALEWMADCVEVRETGVRVASLVRQPKSAAALIMLPRCLSGRRLSEVVLEELAHFLLDTGLGGFLRAEAEGVGAQRNARIVEMTEEAHARAFVRAWHLPSTLMARFRDDAEVSILSRCSLEMIRSRREELAGEVFAITSPPVWSAFPHFLVCERTGPVPTVEITPLNGTEPEFMLPVPEGCGRLLVWQVVADSTALTVDEFRTKYRRWAAGHRVCVRPTMDALQRVLSGERQPALSA